MDGDGEGAGEEEQDNMLVFSPEDEDDKSESSVKHRIYNNLGVDSDGEQDRMNNHLKHKSLINSVNVIDLRAMSPGKRYLRAAAG